MDKKHKNIFKKILINIFLVTVVLMSGFFLIKLAGDTLSLKILFICIILDYILGNSLALAKISKHGNGEISSSIGLIGIVKKIAILFITIVSIYLDKYFIQQSLNIAISNIIIISFIINEVLSIIENARIVNIHLPTGITQKLEDYKENINLKKEKKKNDKNNKKTNN